MKQTKWNVRLCHNSSLLLGIFFILNFCLFFNFALFPFFVFVFLNNLKKIIIIKPPCRVAVDKVMCQESGCSLRFTELLATTRNLPSQIPDSDWVPGGGVQNRPVGVESDLVDLVLSCWDGDSSAGVGRTDVPDIDLTGGPEDTWTVVRSLEKN